jgi:Uma2 family endonuclease
MANESSPSVLPAQAERHEATIEAWLAIPHEKGAQLIRGRFVYEAMPDPLHGRSAGGLFAQLFGPFDRAKGDRDQPGGWWLSMEADLKLGTDGVRPDLCGWRREKHPRCPRPGPKGVVTEAPDWVCEVLSPSTTSVDLEDKRVIYHRAGVAHYWLLDFERRSLMVLRHSPEGYLYILSAFRADIVRAEPFDAIDLHLRQVFPDE